MTRDNKMTAMEGRLKAEWAGFREDMNDRLSKKMDMKTCIDYEYAKAAAASEEERDRLGKRIAMLTKLMRYWVIFFAGLFVGEGLMWLVMR